MKVAALRTSSAMTKSSPLILRNGPLLFIAYPLKYLQNNFQNSCRHREVVSTNDRPTLTLRLQTVTSFFARSFAAKFFAEYARRARERLKRNYAAFLLICRKVPRLEKSC
ncbi:hypothetical protein [Ralstonia condita]|uniref:hypothetical protein n=1 Tax=Ralstonia condita TaxID=3058600 RepID=UPI00292E1000|nr:hypothetical protein [Ralstonia sp. LMG 7141]